MKSIGKKQKIIIIITACTVFAVANVIFWLTFMGLFSSIHPYDKPEDGQIRVACVGDSITYGFGVENWFANSYPKQLNELLGKKYNVNNFGYSGRTAMSTGDTPYVNEKLYKKSLEYAPDIVVIMLGSNDSKPQNWTSKEDYKKEYAALIKTYQDLSSNPEIYICVPPRVYVDKYKINNELIITEIQDGVYELAEELGLPVIDTFSPFENHRDLYYEGVHPNAKGAKVFAKTVFEAIKPQIIIK